MCSVVDEILTSALSEPSLINAKASTQSFYSAEHVFLHYSAVQFPHWKQHHDTPSRPIDFSPDNGLPLVVPPGNVNGGKWSLFSNWVVKKKRNKKSTEREKSRATVDQSRQTRVVFLWFVTMLQLESVWMAHVTEKKKLVWVVYDL